MKIRTNNVPREIIDGVQLTTEERANFDYHDWAAIDEGTDSASFFRYRGDLHDLGNFTRSEGMFPGWDGYESDSMSTGTVVRYVHHHGEWQIVAGYYVS